MPQYKEKEKKNVFGTVKNFLPYQSSKLLQPQNQASWDFYSSLSSVSVSFLFCPFMSVYIYSVLWFLFLSVIVCFCLFLLFLSVLSFVCVVSLSHTLRDSMSPMCRTFERISFFWDFLLRCKGMDRKWVDFDKWWRSIREGLLATQLHSLVDNRGFSTKFVIN